MARAEILRDGAAAFPAMCDSIASARERITFENFIFAGDATGRRFADALAGAARRGVSVRVLYDPIGTAMVRGGSIARVLRGQGVRSRPFRPLSAYAPWTWSRIRHRDHRKTLSVDGRTAVVGGLCISDNWSPSSSGGGGWRDTALRVHGEVAADVECAFDATWHRRPTAAAPPAPATATARSPLPAAMVVEDRPDAHHVGGIYRWLASRARRSIEITDAYMVLRDAELSQLEAAARRGVAVRLLLPGRNNHPVAGAAARGSYARLLSAGVEIFEWAGMVHAKTVVVDGEVSLVGSSNLDPLSLRRNYELNLLLVDPVTGAGMHSMFEQDLARARRIDAASWGARPAWHRFAERAGGWLRPFL